MQFSLSPSMILSPVGQSHSYDPSLFTQVWLHPPLSVSHSFTSGKISELFEVGAESDINTHRLCGQETGFWDKAF